MAPKSLALCALALCVSLDHSPRSLAETPAPTQTAGKEKVDASKLADAGVLFRQGSAAFAAGDLKAAHAAFAQAVQLAPQVAAAHSALGSVLLAEGDLNAAVLELGQATRLEPHETAAIVNLAVARSRLGEYPTAVSLFRSVPAGTALQPSETLAFAIALAADGDRDAAERELQNAVDAAPGDNSAATLWDALGSLQAQDQQWDAAGQSFNRALALSPELAPAHAHRGSLLLAQAVDLPEALAELRRGVQLGDATPATQVELGRALSLNGFDAEALATLRAALSAQPGSVDAQYALALALQAAGQAREAVALFAKVVEARPKDVAALTNYGLALVQVGDAKTGLQQYARAAALGPAQTTLREDTGVAYLQLNDIDHALEQFRAGVAGSPDDPMLHYDLGLAYKLKDDLASSVPELERAENLDPKLSDPPYTLGVIRMQQGQTAEAVRQLQLAVSLAPQNGEAWALLGSVEKDAGDPDKAADALHHAIALQPDQPSPHVVLATILATRGDREGALAERKIAADLSRTAMSKQRAGFSLESGRALLAKGQIPEAIVQLQNAIAAQPELSEAHLLLAEALQKQGRPEDALTERQTAERLATH